MTTTRHSLRRALVAALMVAPPLAAQSAPRDTATIPDRQLFHQSDLYVAGAFVAGTIALLPLDRHLAEAFHIEEQKNNSALNRLSSTARFFGGPGPIIIGPTMYVVGRFGHVPKLAEIAVHGTEAVVVGAAVADVIKIVAGRYRPYVSGDLNPHDFSFGRGLHSDSAKSFPSGHSTAAFSAAAAVVAETNESWPQYTWIVAPVMFGGATVVGLSRMYDNQHWASDVLMGAAIGTFSGLKVVRFNHTHTGNQLDKILLGTTVVPTPNGTALAWRVGF
jgi:membrane-associated phospholipid phosphatase